MPSGAVTAAADLKVSFRVRSLSFCVNPESSLVGRHPFPIVPQRERKHRMKDTYLATPLRENRLHRFGVSARRPSSTSGSSARHVWEVGGEREAGGFCPGGSRGADSWSENRGTVFEGRAQRACEAAARLSSSEMSERPRSNSEMVSRDGGREEREDEEEKERGNMKID